VKLLLDTCTLIWLASDPEQLGPQARSALDDEANGLWLSDACVWEICLKWQGGKLGLPQPPRIWIEEQCRRWGLSTLPILRSHLYRVAELADHHRDPFDRLLVAQAIEESLTVVTPDSWIRHYPVATLW
jgi:PIN domain nuclease of toxin-antitoxin system